MKKTSRGFMTVFAIILFILFIIPIIWMAIASFKPVNTPVSMLETLLSGPFTFDNYKYVFENSNLLRWIGNSLFVSFVVTLVTLIISSMAGYALSKIDFKINKVIFMIILMGIMIPTEAIIIPLYNIMADKQMLNSYFSLIAPSLAAPLGVILFKQFFDSIPKDFSEAAKIDGAGIFSIWLKIFVPLSKNVIATVAILAFISSWNNFLWPFLSITKEEMMTLPVAIPTFSSAYKMDMVLPMTVNFISSIPSIIIFVLFQKNIVKGISSSGIKG